MTPVLRRARPALGTLVELGIRLPAGIAQARRPAWVDSTLLAGWSAVAEVERAMSVFLPESDLGRFNAAKAGASVKVAPATAEVLRTARRLWRESGGLLDASTGSGPGDWTLSDDAGGAVLRKGSALVRLDLGGLAKGFAVDRALLAMVAGLERAGQSPSCWVNAGGDLRTRSLALRVHLRDERSGGARPWLILRDGAVATSDYGPLARARLAGGAARAHHVSVAAPSCFLCDALTKVVALTGRADHPILAAHGAQAWIHDRSWPRPLAWPGVPAHRPAQNRHDAAPID